MLESSSKFRSPKIFQAHFNLHTLLRWEKKERKKRREDGRENERKLKEKRKKGGGGGVEKGPNQRTLNKG